MDLPPIPTPLSFFAEVVENTPSTILKRWYAVGLAARHLCRTKAGNSMITDEMMRWGKGRTPQTLLRNAQVHLCNRHNTRSATDLARFDYADYEAIRILEAIGDLVVFARKTNDRPHIFLED